MFLWLCEQPDEVMHRLVEKLYVHKLAEDDKRTARQAQDRPAFKLAFHASNRAHSEAYTMLAVRLKDTREDFHPDVLSSFLIGLQTHGFSSPAI